MTYRNRPSISRTIQGAALLAAVGLSSHFGIAAERAPRPPNVVLIVADDLGYADVGVQGHVNDVRTPNIDALAKNGVRFTNGYVSCPICSPSRAGLLTGRYQQRFGHEFNPGPAADENFGLPKDQTTIAEAMKKAGHVTTLIGKW